MLRDNAAPPTCDSIDAATRCMRASSYWSLADTMETETVVGNSMHETVVDVGSGSKGVRTSEWNASFESCQHCTNSRMSRYI